MRMEWTGAIVDETCEMSCAGRSSASRWAYDG